MTKANAVLLNRMKSRKNNEKKIKNVDGRLELIKEYPNNIKIFIDYAHTPDALNEVIKSIKENINQSTNKYINQSITNI